MSGTIHWLLQAADAAAEEALSAAERSRLAALRLPKRRADWLLGRTTAKAVVAAALREGLGGEWSPRALEIVAEPGGAPCATLAPEAPPVAGLVPGQLLPVCLSISHAEGHALCAAAFAADGAPRALGIDLGWVEPRSPAMVETFFTEEERRWVDEAPAAEHAVRANLVWCAKEAVLKVLRLGLTVDTRQVTCLPGDALAEPARWSLAPGGAAWRHVTVRCAPALGAPGGAIEGAWLTSGGFALALARR